MKISLTEFTDELAESVNKFKQDWIEDNEKNPADYPLKLSNGDWDEMFMVWLERREKV